MEENEIVRRCGVTQEEWARMLALSNARRRRYHKGEAVLRCGDRGKELGLVEQGSVNIETVDLSGSRSILGHIPRGQVFAETYAFCREVLMVDVTAAEESQNLIPGRPRPAPAPVRWGELAAEAADGAAGHVHPEEPGPVPADVLRHPQNGAGAADHLSRGAGRFRGPPGVLHPL